MSSSGTQVVFRHAPSALRAPWPWLLALGLSLLALSLVALGHVVTTTLATVITYGTLLMAGGVLHLIGAFWARDWSGFFLALAAGVVALVVGVITVRHPAFVSEVLTGLVAAYFCVGGLIRVGVAVALHLPDRVWLVSSGVLNVVMGLLIGAALPNSGFWVIGLFLAVELMSGGCFWIVLALKLRRLKKGLV
jgi:uncharacterized membrane protein HdeD (DUF308 family)